MTSDEILYVLAQRILDYKVMDPHSAVEPDGVNHGGRSSEGVVSD